MRKSRRLEGREGVTVDGAECQRRREEEVAW